MEPRAGTKVMSALVASLMVIAFSAIDYAARPRLSEYFGDDDIYVLVIVLAVEFMVIWGTVAHLTSTHRQRRLNK